MSLKNFKTLIIFGLILALSTYYFVDYRNILMFNNIDNEVIELDRPNLKLSKIPKVFSLVSDPPENESWNAVKNNGFIFPDSYGIDKYGCYASHIFDSSINSSRNYPSIRWERTINMSDDMSQCNILSMSVSAIVNATVHANNGTGGGIESFSEYRYDFAYFYVLISNIEKTEEYVIASNMTYALGNDTAGTYDFLFDTQLPTLPENDLIHYISNALESDHHSFIVSLGIDIYCDVDFPSDIDYWDVLRIKSFNLTFTYDDNILPSIVVIEPRIFQVFGEDAPNINLSIVEPNLDCVWYTLDDDFTKVFITSFEGKIDEVLWDSLSDKFIFVLKIYANDTFGNINFKAVKIFKFSFINNYPITQIVAFDLTLIFIFAIISIILRAK